MDSQPGVPRDDETLNVELDDEPASAQKPLVIKGVGEKRRLADWLIVAGIPGVVAIVGIVAMVLWLRGEPQVKAGDQRVSGQQVAATPQQAPAAGSQATGAAPVTPSSASAATTPAPGTTTTTAGGGPSSSSSAPSSRSQVASEQVGSSGSWPGFRGANRNGISGETGLSRSWRGGPKRLWSVSLGEGHAGAAVADGKLYVLDYDAGARKDVLRCLNLSNGKPLWTQGYAADIKRNHGMSRTVPAVSGKYVVTLGPLGTVMCCDTGSGKVIWKKNLVAEYGTVIPQWYAGQCPLIENNNAIIAPGGKALMIAIHLPTGKITWTTPNPRGWQMTHSSITPTSFGGKRIYIYPASGGVVGVNARDGKMLWDTPEWTVNTSNIPAPVVIGDGRVFFCGGYNSGAMMVKMNDSATAVSKLFRVAPNTFQSHQQTPILYKGHLYGVKVPGELVCMDLNGKIVWSSGSTARFGLGPYLLADGMLYVLSDKGELALVEASPSGYKQLARAKVLSGSDAWAPMALVDGKLLCRDLTTMVCLDVK